MESRATTCRAKERARRHHRRRRRRRRRRCCLIMFVLHSFDHYLHLSLSPFPNDSSHVTLGPNDLVCQAPSPGSFILHCFLDILTLSENGKSVTIISFM